MLAINCEEDREKICEILEPFAEVFFSEDEISTEMYIDGFVSFDKMAEIVEYIRKN
jgi:hypothetical protein